LPREVRSGKRYAVTVALLVQRVAINFQSTFCAWHNLCGQSQSVLVSRLEKRSEAFSPDKKLRSWLFHHFGRSAPPKPSQPIAQNFFIRNQNRFGRLIRAWLFHRPGKHRMITILLVDHSLECERSVRSLWRALPPDQFQVNGCAGYHAILEGFRSQTADVCVIDSGTGNGLKLLAQARAMGMSAPIVMVTANDASEVVAAIRSGAADCLVRDQLTTASIEHSICCVVQQACSLALQAQRERRYLALFDSLEEITYTHDLGGRITSMNPAGLYLLGYSHPEILGMEVSAIVAAASKPLVSLSMDLMLDAQRRTVNEVRLATKSGKSLAVKMSAHPIYEQGEPVEVQVLATVITEPPALYGKFPDGSSYSSRTAVPYRPPSMNRSNEARAF
jgi:PAS domain S-box-containing protein